VIQTWRYLFAATAVLFLAGVVVQVYLAGVGLFGAGSIENHRGLGYILSIAPVIPLLFAWPARAGQRTVILCAALLVAAFVQSILPSLKGSVPLIAALHPLNAILVFGLSVVVARRAVGMVRVARLAPVEEPAPAQS
jgi:hypothetical protein